MRDLPFNWNAELDPASLRVGYFQSAFERDYPQKEFDAASLEVLRSQGINPVPVELPEFPYNAMRIILTAEAAAAFDELTRGELDDQLTRQDEDAWPNIFRVGRFIPAADYVNANRVRTLAMRGWADLFSELDVIVTPTSGTQLVATNLTGHPALILPNGFQEDGTPVSLTFLGDPYGEAKLLSVAKAYQDATDFHLQRPPLLG